MDTAVFIEQGESQYFQFVDLLKVMGMDYTYELKEETNDQLPHNIWFGYRNTNFVELGWMVSDRSILNMFQTGINLISDESVKKRSLKI